MYKHRLPPGFILKAQKKEQEAAEKANEITLEEFLEHQRKRLPTTQLTPVTAETFAIWKKQRQDKKQAEEELARNKKATQAQANKLAGLSGKEMFTLNPEMFGDDDEEDGDGGEVSNRDGYWRAEYMEARRKIKRLRSGKERLPCSDIFLLTIYPTLFYLDFLHCFQFELSQYMKNWQQERDEEEKAEQVYGDDEEDQDDKPDVNGTSEKVGEMSINGDEGNEEGRRKD